MANVHIDYDQLSTTASRLQKGQTEIEGQLKQLKSLVDNLVSSGFVTDQAGPKFQQSYQQWNTGAKNVVAGLDGMKDFLTKAIQQHRDLDSQLGKSTGG